MLTDASIEMAVHNLKITASHSPRPPYPRVQIPGLRRPEAKQAILIKLGLVATVAVVTRLGDWAMVDLGFDGLIDGAVHVCVFAGSKLS